MNAIENALDLCRLFQISRHRGQDAQDPHETWYFRHQRRSDGAERLKDLPTWPAACSCPRILWMMRTAAQGHGSLGTRWFGGNQENRRRRWSSHPRMLASRELGDFVLVHDRELRMGSLDRRNWRIEGFELDERGVWHLYVRVGASWTRKFCSLQTSMRAIKQ